MTQPAFRLRAVAKTFSGTVEALSPTSFDIAAGSFVSLVGPSGCGKSTLLRLLAGLLEPSAGDVARTGRSGEIGFVFQDPTLMPWASVAENVALPLALNGSPAHPLAEALERVGLANFADAYPRELSGGMRMRASIARAMVTNPRAILMDEPFAALDEFTRFRLNDDLHGLWRRNRWTVVFVTHSIREAVFLSQRILVMSPRPGRVIADLAVPLPDARVPELRSSHELADVCARVSEILGGAMAGAEHPP